MGCCLMIFFMFSISLNVLSLGACLVIKLSMSPKCLGPGPEAQGPGPRPGPKGLGPGPTVGRTDGRAGGNSRKIVKIKKTRSKILYKKTCLPALHHFSKAHSLKCRFFGIRHTRHLSGVGTILTNLLIDVPKFLCKQPLSSA